MNEGHGEGGNVMSRSSAIRNASPEKLDQVHRLLKQPLQPWQRRRLETLLLHTAGHTAVDIAALLGVHVNTVYGDLRLFHRRRLHGLLSRRRLGAPPRLTAHQRRTICRLAEQSPTELGRPYGRWSLTKLRDYLLAHRIVRRISREHLRRVLKKGGTRSDASPASCGARTPTAGVSCTGSGSCGRTGHEELSCCFSM
jgi:transposase